jgi:hypothetical protein
MYNLVFEKFKKPKLNENISCNQKSPRLQRKS